jgi:N-methylhydantoinase A
VPARIGIDTGGTFTDVVRWSPRGLEVHKLPSTPDDPGRAVLAGLALARRDPGETVDVVHGTTVGLNAVLTGGLAKTAFVTNRGFEDLIEIGRQDRSDIYALEPSRPEVPVPRALRVGVRCRRGAGGGVVEALTGAEIARTVSRLRRLRPAAVAVGLLHSPTDASDELRLAAAIRRALPGAPVTASAELWPALGEFERFVAAILNAAIQPLVGAYSARLQAGLGPGRLRLLRSSTGILPSDEAAAFPARAMFSGPAGGVLATASLAAAAGHASAAAFDMGGTSTDVCLVRQEELLTDQGRIAGLPLPLPSVGVHTVGCGGGSIAFVDRGGALRVGPHSAGADPGPACYGKGGEATVTDAHVALGHLGPDTLLGGAFPVDPDAAVHAIERVAKKLGLPALRTARGILEVADANMARALMVITAERAIDPRDVPLCAYGGAGGLHAAALAARLGMAGALIPHHPGAFSAVGLALAGESAEAAESLLVELTPRTERELRARARELARETAARLGSVRGARTAVHVVLRFRGQGPGLRLGLGRGSLRAAFAAEHRRRFGFLPEGAPAEAVLLLVRATGPDRAMPRPRGPTGRQDMPRGRRTPPLGGRALTVLARDRLPTGAVLPGPCVIEEYTGATLVPAGHSAEVELLGLSVLPGQRRPNG